MYLKIPPCYGQDSPVKNFAGKTQGLYFEIIILKIAPVLWDEGNPVFAQRNNPLLRDVQLLTVSQPTTSI
jgi:hypothetical protein